VASIISIVVGVACRTVTPVSLITSNKWNGSFCEL
jgi:hypothetical protein